MTECVLMCNRWAQEAFRALTESVYLRNPTTATESTHPTRKPDATRLF